MKLRSIALAGLLGTGLLMSSGCSLEDTLQDILKTNVVYTTNGTTVSGTFSATNATDQVVASNSFTVFPLAGDDTTTVTFNGASDASFAYGNIHHYIATTCNANGYLAHTADATKMHIVNLTGNTYDANKIIIKQADGTTLTSSAAYNPCTIGAASDFNNIVIENGMSFSTDGGGSYTNISDIDSDYLAIANNIKFDMVIFADSTGVLVPMAGYDDLLNF